MGQHEREEQFLGRATRSGSHEGGMHCHFDNQAPGVLGLLAVALGDITLKAFLT